MVAAIMAWVVVAILAWVVAATMAWVVAAIMAWVVAAIMTDGSCYNGFSCSYNNCNYADIHTIWLACNLCCSVWRHSLMLEWLAISSCSVIYCCFKCYDRTNNANNCKLVSLILLKIPLF